MTVLRPFPAFRLWSNASIDGKRTLKKVDGKYWALYGCYPSRSGYEAGDGGQGMAFSEDGVAWERVSATVPVTEGGAAQKTKWNSRVVYQPFLVESNGTYYDFYNAAGINEFGEPAEETGFSTLYGDFDIILDHLSRIPQLHITLHTPHTVFYLVPRLTSCRLGLAIRCCVQIGASCIRSATSTLAAATWWSAA